MSENFETTIVRNHSNVILIEDAMKNLQTGNNLSIKSITKYIIANDQVDDAKFFSSIKKSVIKRRQINEAQNKVADKRTSTKSAKKVATKVKRSKKSTKIENARKIKRSISFDSKITNPKLHICIVDKFNRRSKLLEMLSNENRNRAVVFVDSSRTADFLAGYLSESGIPTSSIHAERWPWQRYEVLHDFKIGHMKAIIATAEGLHELSKFIHNKFENILGIDVN